MASALPQIGLESRETISPVKKVGKTPGVFGPDYSFADNVLLPNQVGVYSGSSFESVWDSVKAMGYYVDMIGFGQSSSGLSRGRPVQPLGVNTWVKTGLSCQNGADMWVYLSGIPDGTAFGKRVAAGLAGAGLPPLKGLAPGIMEDAKGALDPSRVVNAVFGTGFAFCEYQVKKVGDQNGKLLNEETGNYFMDDPDTVKDGMQGRWTQTGELSEAEWRNAPKTHCPDGYPIRDHEGNSCMGKLLTASQTIAQGGTGKASISGFVGSMTTATNSRNHSWRTYVLVGVALTGAYIFIKQLQKR